MVFAAKQKKVRRRAVSSSYLIQPPVRGWIANEALANAKPGGARLLENWFPTKTSARLRGGSRKYATISTGPVLRMWTYKSGTAEQFFASDQANIFDITNVVDADVIPTAEVTGQSAGYYSTAQFGTAGGDYLYAVNGADDALLYDGSTFTAINTTSTPAFTGVATSALSFVWSFASRLFFIEKNTMNVWYLPVDSIGGLAKVFSLAGVFQEGGSLLMGGKWSMDSGDGLDDKWVVVSTQGEVAVFQGTNPESAADWQKVGIYKVTPPMGMNCQMQAGGDLLIGVEDGIVPISQAVNKDEAALSLASVTAAIEPEWKKEVIARRTLPWEIMKWPTNNMMVVSLPVVDDGVQPYCFVANLETGAWTKFTGWETRSLCRYGIFGFFGTNDGTIHQMDVGGSDDGLPYVCSYVGMPDLLRGAGERGAAIASTVMNGGTYDENLALAQDISQKAQDAHPYVTTGANIAGAVAGTAPLIAAAPVAFGARGGSVLTRALASGASGAAIGGSDAAVRSGGDIDAIKRGVMWGGGTGLVAPVAANLIGKGTKSLINAGRNWRAARAAGMKPESLSHLTRAATDDGLDAAAMSARLADMGPDAMLADLGPNLQKQAGALAASPGRGQEIVRTALVDRQAGANARIGAAIDDNLGPRSVVPSEVNATIQANQQALGPQYGEVFQKPTRYDFTAITDDLDKSVKNLRGDAQRGLQRVRDMMNVHNTNQVTTDPRIAFETRQAIDGMLATETNPKVIGALSETRQMLDDALRASVPRIKEVDANFSELARQREALQRGQTVLASGREAPRPSELVREVQDGALPQNMQIGPSAVPLRLSQGARAEVERIVGNNANDVVALNRLIKGEGDWNRSRLATLFGQDKADRLIKVLDNERTFADTANTVTRNSETAARIAAQDELGINAGGFGAAESFKADASTFNRDHPTLLLIAGALGLTEAQVDAMWREAIAA
ncbi:hypothetical protein [Agrobacterium salinitolerans]|uniref:hypothetical protein n=1 Tax=Agrobacterium salinitolerans TaxID=1183413 RepID=UPI0015722AE8|nr:hypothetical protein [Agrobacterium salinitolerans]